MKKKDLHINDKRYFPHRPVRGRFLLSLRIFVVSIFGVFLIAPFPATASAAALAFGWGTPILINHNNQISYLAWPIQISNPTRKPWFTRIDIVAVTDTGKQYAAIPDLRVGVRGEVTRLSRLRSNIFPDVTRRAVAVFEAVDPNATVVHFYVGGVIGISHKDKGEQTYFRITYRRTLTGWKWDASDTLE